MFRLLLLCLLMGFCSCGSSPTPTESDNSEELTVVENGQPGESIACSADGSFLAIAGFDHVSISMDSGASWQSVGMQWANDIACSTDGLHVAVSGRYSADVDGKVRVSHDSGSVFTTTTLNLSMGYRGVTVSDDGLWIATISDLGSEIYTSDNGGTSWTAHTLPEAGTVNMGSIAGSADGLFLAACGYLEGEDSGLIYTSSDGGENWTKRQTGPADRAWAEIAASEDGDKLAIIPASAGCVFTSVDGGVTWAERSGTGGHEWDHISISADGRRVVAYSYTDQLMAVSLDGGDSWKDPIDAPSGTSQRWDTAMCISADGSRIYLSTDQLYTYMPQ
jgi:photosystem II stability/assembly factor-like uncharacterized protein